VSRILPDLEKRGLIVRGQVDTDLRRSVVSLEPMGLRLIAAHAPFSEEMYAKIARRFGAERTGELLTLLRELEASLEELSREQESGAAAKRRSSR
ncbi:MAG: homoprotocatechuate degradation operon regulator HpaR, partial [Steroidobacteraceae bacterium]